MEGGGGSLTGVPVGLGWALGRWFKSGSVEYVSFIFVFISRLIYIKTVFTLNHFKGIACLSHWAGQWFAINAIKSRSK